MNLQRDYQHAGWYARAIVAKRVPTLTGLGIILGELVRAGVIPDGLSDQVTHWATVAFTVLGVIAGVLWAQRGTTPADPSLHPVDSHGDLLVSDLTVGPHAGTDAATADATDALAAAEAIHPMGDPAAPVEAPATAPSGT